MPPPKVPVPIVVKDVAGRFAPLNAALWLPGTTDVKPGQEFTMEDVLHILREIRWCTTTGVRIPANAFAWYVVPSFNPDNLFEGNVNGKL